MSNLFHDPGAPATGHKILLATTAYDSPGASYTYAIQHSRPVLESEGIQTAYLLLSGNCHVDDARNSVVKEFLQTDCTDLVFIDADVCWEPSSLVRLCKHNCDIVGGIYPKRRLDPDARFDMPLRMIEGKHEANIEGLVEVEGLPTGFMRIRRHVIERLVSEADQFYGRGARTNKIPILFERTFEDGNRYGGDIEFCRKWRKAGGRVYADMEMRLGHVATAIVWDSLGAALRRQTETTLSHVVEKIRDKTWTLDDLSEARRYANNTFGALEDVLSLGILKAQKAEGDILEIGSGLTTIFMAAATPHRVWCLEHDPVWAHKLEQMAYYAGVSNISLCRQPIRDGWYDLSDIEGELPGEFSLALVDGPPRQHGSRVPFYERLADICAEIVIDDVDDPGYRKYLEEWAPQSGRRIEYVADRAALVSKPLKQEKAA